MASLLLQIVLYFIIAHKVEPTSLGHYFLISTLIFVPAGIMEYGFVSSLIHHEHPQKADYVSVFRINLKVTILYLPVGLLACLLMSWWYKVPVYIYYFLLLVPVLFFYAFNSVNSAGLRKELKIKQSAMIEFCGTLTLFLVTAGLLYAGWGVKALIAGQLARVMIICIALAMTTGYIGNLKSTTDPDSRQGHWDYGKYVIGEKMVGIGLAHADVFLVNHFLGSATLGIYDLLKRMIFRPLVVAYTAMEQVTFPLLSAESKNSEKFRAVFVSMIKANYIFFVTLLGVFIVDWALLFLPEGYQDMERVVELLLVLGVSVMILNPVDIVAYSLDKTKAYYRWVLGYGVVQLVVMGVALKMGLVEFLMAMIGFNLLVYVLSYFVVVKKTSGISASDWLKPVMLFLTFMLILYITMH